MIGRFFGVLFSLTSIKQKKALWKVENMYRKEMSELASELEKEQVISPLSLGRRKEYGEKADELLRIRNRLVDVIKEQPDRIDNTGNFIK